jgi:hypothetical protein
MQTPTRTRRASVVGQKAWRALDFVVSALFIDTIEYPQEYNRARELNR